MTGWRENLRGEHISLPDIYRWMSDNANTPRDIYNRQPFLWMSRMFWDREWRRTVLTVMYQWSTAKKFIGCMNLAQAYGTVQLDMDTLSQIHATLCLKTIFIISSMLQRKWTTTPSPCQWDAGEFSSLYHTNINDNLEITLTELFL